MSTELIKLFIKDACLPSLPEVFVEVRDFGDEGFVRYFVSFHDFPELPLEAFGAVLLVDLFVFDFLEQLLQRLLCVGIGVLSFCFT
jgi:hypothetical protein